MYLLCTLPWFLISMHFSNHGTFSRYSDSRCFRYSEQFLLAFLSSSSSLLLLPSLSPSLNRTKILPVQMALFANGQGNKPWGKIDFMLWHCIHVGMLNALVELAIHSMQNVNLSEGFFTRLILLWMEIGDVLHYTYSIWPRNNNSFGFNNGFLCCWKSLLVNWLFWQIAKAMFFWHGFFAFFIWIEKNIYRIGKERENVIKVLEHQN